MKQNYWLERMDAAVETARDASCTEACLASLHRAGVYSVLARAAQVSTAEGGEQ